MGRVDPSTLLFFDASCLIAAAIAVRADVILTLDRPLAREIEQAAFGIPARSPGDFIQFDLTTHPFFDSLREE